VYVLSPFLAISTGKSVLLGGVFSGGHRWGILGGHQGLKLTTYPVSNLFMTIDSPVVPVRKITEYMKPIPNIAKKIGMLKI
jgi:hypothetical protein